MLSAQALTRYYGRLCANQALSLTLAPGEVVALLGENGAGKSTLVRMLCGLEKPDRGSITLDGQPRTWRSVQQATHAGVAAVHQHFALIPRLTGWEHFRLSQSLAPERIKTRLSELVRDYGLEVPLDQPVGQLPVTLQQRIELLRALLLAPRYLLLDEPTAVFSPTETAAIQAMLTRLSAAGLGILLVTHRLSDVMACAHRVMVLRQGRVTLECARSATTPAQLGQAMVGTLPESDCEQERPPTGTEPLLEVTELCHPAGPWGPALEQLTLTVHAGEIVGLGGVGGSGQELLAEIITGLRRPSSGRLRFRGQDISLAPPHYRQSLGLAHVPADRQQHGVAKGLPVCWNLCLRKYGQSELSPGGWRRTAHWFSFAQQLRARMSARWVLEQPAGQLSGGHQQRLILARELEAGPHLLVAVYPTRGLDLRAARQVRELLLAQRRAGQSVLLISEDLEELLALSDQLIFFSGGRVTGQLSRAQATAELVGQLIGGG